MFHIQSTIEKAFIQDFEWMNEWPFIPIHICEFTGKELPWSVILITGYIRVIDWIKTVITSLFKKFWSEIWLPITMYTSFTFNMLTIWEQANTRTIVWLKEDLVCLAYSFACSTKKTVSVFYFSVHFLIYLMTILALFYLIYH